MQHFMWTDTVWFFHMLKVRIYFWSLELAAYPPINFMCLIFSTQISILDSYCPGPKQEVGKANVSVFLPHFLSP